MHASTCCQSEAFRDGTAALLEDGLRDGRDRPDLVAARVRERRDRLRALTSYETGSEAIGKGRLYVDGSYAVEEYFDGKPASLSIFRAIADVIDGSGTSAMTVGSQISFGRERKFAWFWLYNVTKKNPDGVPHLMLAIDHGVDSEHVRNVEQIGKSRWNHQIVVRTLGDARSPWLAKLVGLAHDYGSG